MLRPDKPDIVVIFCFYDVEDGSKCLNTVNKILEAWTSHTLTSLILCRAADPIFGTGWLRIQFFSVIRYGFRITPKSKNINLKQLCRKILSSNIDFWKSLDPDLRWSDPKKKIWSTIFIIILRVKNLNPKNTGWFQKCSDGFLFRVRIQIQSEPF